MSNYKWLLDAGHGGLTSDGRYTTAPAKMHVFDDGLTFYEGVNNRAIVNALIAMLNIAGIDFDLVYNPVLDTPLAKRVEKANRIHATEKRCIYVSIHSDAMPEGAHGKGSGFSVYSTKGWTSSDTISQIFCDTYHDYLPEFRFREDLSDGDGDFEEDFYVLRKTTCPAILIENLFFDNRREAEFLMSKEGQERIAETLLMAMLCTEKSKPV
jgi:N-acetylmuramoyl-L-alanine amidase